MIIYNKYYKRNPTVGIPFQTLKTTTRPLLSEENKIFLKSLNLELKQNV